MNELLQDARFQLDGKKIECRRRPLRLATRAREAALEVEQMGAKLAFERAKVVDAAAKTPVERKRFAELKSDVAFQRDYCAKDAESSHHRHLALKKDALSIERAKVLLASQCAGSSALVQVPANRSCDAMKQRVRKKHGIDKTAGHHPKLAELMEVLPSGCQMSAEECAKVKADLEEINGEVYDNQMRLRDEDMERAIDCEMVSEFEKQEMTGAARRQADLQGQFSGGMAQLSVLIHEEQQLYHMSAQDEEDLRNSKVQCEQDVHRMLTKRICELTRLRDSLWLLAGAKEVPVDCEVSDWEDLPCSVTCGKGTRTSTREVIVQAYNGTECPPLSMVQECEETLCPSHCEISEWSGWSKCSAQCDTGVEERTRSVLTQAHNGGDACPHLVETRICNRSPCNQDCKLSEWSEWAACSKLCGGGTRIRHRQVIGEPIGDGKCTRDMREEAQACNPSPCPAGMDYTCHGSLEDVVLVVDTSGAVTAAQFTQMKSLTASLVERYVPTAAGVNVGVFAMGDSQREVSGLEHNGESLAERVSSNLTMLHGGSMLGKSLFSARTLLRRRGRAGAFSTVVVLTTGRVADPHEARQAARRLKKAGAHVLLVLVGSEATKQKFLEGLVSQPASQNMFRVGDLDSDESVIAAAQRIVTRTCSRLASP